jgi:hypothetical protein
MVWSIILLTVTSPNVLMDDNKSFAMGYSYNTQNTQSRRDVYKQEDTVHQLTNIYTRW